MRAFFLRLLYFIFDFFHLQPEKSDRRSSGLRRFILMIYSDDLTPVS